MTKLRLASMLVLVGLLALVFAIGMACAYKLKLPPDLVFPASASFAAIIVLVQYMVGPLLLDWVLDVRWASPLELGADFATWHHNTCKTFRISEPQLGIIEDGMPNAFTYGHGAWDGRVIITRGLVNILEPEELKAVYAHELGHIKNRDFIMMTLVQALVLVLYTFARGSRFTSNRNMLPIMLASYAAYWVSYYISLLFSRLREYMADYASAQILRNPNLLCTALVKISYGLAQTTAVPSKPAYQTPFGSPVPAPRTPYQPAPQYAAGQPAYRPSMAAPPVMPSGGAFHNADYDKAMAIAATFQRPEDVKEVARKQKQRQATLQSLGAFGIASPASMRAAVAWYQPGSGGLPANFAQVARWELYNPWARIAEVVSTHPLTAFRIRALQKLNRLFGAADVFDFKKVQPAKYGKFLRDLIVLSLPVFGLAAGLALSITKLHESRLIVAFAVPALGLIAGALVKLIMVYAVGTSGRRKVLQILSEVDVSHVNPKYVVVEGTFTGRLEAGFFWAKDFILQDETGFISCIFRQPLLIWEGLFGWLTAGALVGRPVRVHGWYRRFNSPFLEIDKFEMLDTRETHKAYQFPTYLVLYLLALISVAALLVFVK